MARTKKAQGPDQARKDFARLGVRQLHRRHVHGGRTNERVGPRVSAAHACDLRAATVAKATDDTEKVEATECSQWPLSAVAEVAKSATAPRDGSKLTDQSAPKAAFNFRRNTTYFVRAVKKQLQTGIRRMRTAAAPARCGIRTEPTAVQAPSGGNSILEPRSVRLSSCTELPIANLVTTITYGCG